MHDGRRCQVIDRIERHNKHFTQIQNSTLRDCRLSYGARGVLVFLLSFPDDKKIDPENIVEEGQGAREGTEQAYKGPKGDRDRREGIYAIREALRELKAAGYLRNERFRGPDGQFYWETVLYEVPPQPDSESVDNTPVDNAKPPRENQQMVPPGETSNFGVNAQVGPYRDSPSRDFRDLKKNKKERRLEEQNFFIGSEGEAFPAQRAGAWPIERQRLIAEGRGCPDCETSGVILDPETDLARQCERCQASGILQPSGSRR